MSSLKHSISFNINEYYAHVCMYLLYLTLQLEDDVNNFDIMQQLSQYGVIRGISKLSAKESAVKRCIAFIDFKDSISVRRVFSNKIFIKGKLVKVTLSRLALGKLCCPNPLIS